MLQEHRSCNTQSCPPMCELTQWTVYSNCSLPCGGGTQTRTRSISQLPDITKPPCGQLTQQQHCNTGRCMHCDTVVIRPATAHSYCSTGLKNGAPVLAIDTMPGTMSGDLSTEWVCPRSLFDPDKETRAIPQVAGDCPLSLTVNAGSHCFRS